MDRRNRSGKYKANSVVQNNDHDLNKSYQTVPKEDVTEEEPESCGNEARNTDPANSNGYFTGKNINDNITSSEDEKIQPPTAYGELFDISSATGTKPALPEKKTEKVSLFQKNSVVLSLSVAEGKVEKIVTDAASSKKQNYLSNQNGNFSIDTASADYSQLNVPVNSAATISLTSQKDQKIKDYLKESLSSNIEYQKIQVNIDSKRSQLSAKELLVTGDKTQPGSVPIEPTTNYYAHNWQATKSTVKERLAYLFNSDVLADVHFVVGKPPTIQRIPAHKFLLSASSAVFDALFHGGLSTSSNEVDIPDIEAPAFLSLLRFLYCDEVSLTADTVMAVLYAAKKYTIPALEKACVDYLKLSLNSDNAFTLLGQARFFDEPQLAELCLETIDKNSAEAFASDGFLDVDIKTLCTVVQRDSLGVREIKLFNALCRWAEAECHRQQLPVTAEHQRQVLGEALSFIRFPLMTLEDFANGPAQSCILSDRETVDLFLYFTTNPKPTLRFVDAPRCCLTGRELIVSRFCQTEHRWGYSGTSDRIR